MPSSEVMHKWKTGKLHSGSKTGPKVKSQKQAIAIMLSEKRAEQKHGGHYPEKALGGPMLGQPQLPTTPMMGAPSGIAPGMGTPMMGAATGMGTPMAGAARGAMGPMGAPGPMMGAPQGIAPQYLAVGGIAQPGVGNFNMAKQANLNASPMLRSADRGLMHGPIMSNVPGRTDAHKTAVPSGSYVIPADVVSGRGQGNTMAGMQSLQKMFRMGPYGSPPGAVKPGRTMPMGGMKAPKPMMASSAGGSRGSHVGKPVPVNVAGGELIVPPENVVETVRRITKDPRHTLETSHNVLDKWVVNERKKHVKTLAKLPGPVKD